MTEERLSDALDECLVLLMEEQVSVEDCLARHPEHDAQLRGLLELALALKRVPQPTAAPTAVSEGKRRMLEALSEKQQQGTPSLFARFETWISTVLGGEGAHTSAKRMAPALRIALAGAVALVLVVGGLLVHSWLDAVVPRCAVLEMASGPVMVRPIGEEAWAPASVGERLASGDSLRTGAGAAATVRFFDGSVSVMDGEAELVLDEMRGRRVGSVRFVALEQRRGRVYHQVQRLRSPDSAFVVMTPAGVARVRGTAFVVNVAQDGVTEVSVREGSVEVTSGDASVDLLPGWATKVEPEGEPAPPFEAPESVFDGLPPAALEPLLPGSRGATETATQSPQPTATAVPRATATPTPSVTPLQGDSSDETSKPRPTAQPLPATSTATEPARVTATPLPTETDSPTPTSTPTSTPTEVREETPLPLPTEPPTPTPTSVQGETPPPLPTEPPTATPTPGSPQSSGGTPPPLPTEPATATPDPAGNGG